MDIWIRFENATKWQAESLFQCFFPGSTLSHPVSAASQSLSHEDVMPVTLALGDTELANLARRFADAIPDGEFSVSDCP